MNTLPPDQASSLKSITRSIETDYYTYRWFTFLLNHPPIRQELVQSGEIKPLYVRLQKNSVLITILLLAILGKILFIVKTGPLDAFWIAAVLSAVAFKLHSAQRLTISAIGKYFLTKEYDEKNFSTKSLYEITELYARRYNLPSLVSTMCRSDQLCRKAILVILLFDVIVYFFFIPFSLLTNILCLAGIYATIIILINTRLSYTLIRP